MQKKDENLVSSFQNCDKAYSLISVSSHNSSRTKESATIGSKFPLHATFWSVGQGSFRGTKTQPCFHSKQRFPWLTAFNAEFISVTHWPSLIVHNYFFPPLTAVMTTSKGLWSRLIRSISSLRTALA